MSNVGPRHTARPGGGSDDGTHLVWPCSSPARSCHSTPCQLFLLLADPLSKKMDSNHEHSKWTVGPGRDAETRRSSVWLTSRATENTRVNQFKAKRGSCFYDDGAAVTRCCGRASA
ncbi:hypothetical protein BC567DRAFT_24675 [Phyllosticta citribraziliensis]